MYRLSRFKLVDGRPDEDEVMEFVDAYFFNTMTVLNAFFAKIEMAEALSRLELIPFGDLISEELADEDEQTISQAVERITELAEMELEVIRSYLE
ncbi:MAG: hypothetical protein GXY34_07170 [Syntrophomonadaceae bacterium]|nr:hypothetical protein [Syntrophomonadaceae bacterium]